MDQNQNQYNQVMGMQDGQYQQSQQYAQQPIEQQQYVPQATMYAQHGLTGGQKAAWLFVGLFLNIAGILLATVTNLDYPERKSDAIKFAAIGFGIIVVLYILLFGMMGCSVAMLGGSSGYL